MIASDPTDVAIAILIVVPVVLALAFVAACALGDGSKRPTPKPPLPEMPRPVEMTPARREAVRVARVAAGRPADPPRRRTEAEERVLAEMEAEHEALSARPERVARAEALIDRVLPDPSVPKGER